MWSSQKPFYLASAALLALGCNDILTGQDQPPDGPIQVLRLTLSDTTSRDHTIFTDTSLPDCKPVTTNQVDCTQDQNRDSHICQVCYNDVFKDMYSQFKSPPTPDSGADMRVVFNKAPSMYDDTELANDWDPVKDAMSQDPAKQDLANSVKLFCSDCSGVPALRRFLLVSGSNVSFDPTTVSYGPSLRMVVDPTDPRSSLEAGSHYTVQVDSHISFRDGNKWQPTPEQTAILSFQTEAFKILRVGRGDSSKDTWVYTADASAGLMVADQPRDAAVVLRMNASLFAGGLDGITATATAAPGGPSVPIKLASNVRKGSMGCTQDSQRYLYIYPTAGTWPSTANEVDIHIPAGSLFDVAQGGTYGQGKHNIGADINISVKFSAMPATTGYTKVADAIAVSKC